MPLQEPSPDMVIDVVDRHNRSVGTAKRKEIFRLEGGFRTVHVFVVNSAGQLLLQQQSHKRTRAPLTWGSSVAAYLFSGESYEEAAVRRTEQELGIEIKDFSLVGVVRVNDLGHDKFVGLVTCHSDGPFKFDRTHIERLEFVDLKQINRHKSKHDIAFTPTFLALLKLFRQAREQRTT